MRSFSCMRTSRPSPAAGSTPTSVTWGGSVRCIHAHPSRLNAAEVARIKERTIARLLALSRDFIADRVAPAKVIRWGVLANTPLRDDTLSAPDAVGFAQRLVDGPGTTSARREIRRVARFEFVAAPILSDEGRATANEMAELRINGGASEGAGGRFPGASLDRAVRRCIGSDATERR